MCFSFELLIAGLSILVFGGHLSMVITAAVKTVWKC